MKAVLFDLDGTLLNSIIDIAETINQVLNENNFNTHTIDEYKFMVGEGIEKLVRDSFPDNVDEPNFRKYLKKTKDIYSKRWMLKTRPYPGIIEMLDELEKRGIKMSILSNKPDVYTKLAVFDFFQKYKFEEVRGAIEGIPKKPDPTAAIQIAKQIGIKPQEIVYVGDSQIDMKTAKGANMYPVGVSWGFRPKKELIENGAEKIIEKPIELLELF